MGRKLIQWPRAVYWDKPWNPYIGCRPASPACENCYARTIAGRFKMNVDFTPQATKQTQPPTTKVVFCGNMTDIAGEWLGTAETADIVRRTLGNPKAVYLWLTKRPARLAAAVKSVVAEQESNQYFGFTAENQEWYDRRLNEFRESGVEGRANLWLSAEPLLGPIDLGPNPPFRWIVVGCESGTKRRPCSVEWVADIVRQARVHAIPVFVKQLDVCGACERDIAKFPSGLKVRQVPWLGRDVGTDA